ncbi:hypothetical protein [Streptomyces sp. NBC_00199]|uniref:hypothetical protein n=1 Tax=Streptomyces sp. NBC_00199 TaxID=2975678 RepID=UPI00224E8904|nr:hypothetical protein [Streptomyces sp. NBC_00199]MCX5266055.1 hypothetical protein [Streptomyces sp. NBC_00199]
MIRISLDAAGTAVRLSVSGGVAALLDDLAIAYAADPAAVGSLLASHSVRVLRLDAAEVTEDTPDHIRAMRAAEADGSREALLGECPSTWSLDPLLTPDEAVTLAARLTKHAAHIRHTTQNGNPRT